VRKLVLTICLLSVVAFAAAQNGGNQNGQFPKNLGHAPEMSSNRMAVAGDAWAGTAYSAPRLLRQN